MVNVSEDYINTLEQPGIRNRTAELIINDFDVNMQANLELISSKNYTFVLPSDVAKMTEYIPFYLATSEPGRMKMNGGQTFQMTDQQYHIEGEFISNALSQGVAVNGVYPIDDGGMVFEITSGTAWSSVKKPISIKCDEAIKEIYIKVVDSTQVFENTYAVENGYLAVDNIPNEQYDEITIKVTALSRPYNRARIGRVLIGRSESFEGEQVVSTEYEEVNDCINETLPYKRLKVSLVNEGRLSQMDDYNNPRYKRLHTQATLNFSQPCENGSELIFMGKWYLDDYTISKDVLELVFFDSIGVLNEEEYPWYGHQYHQASATSWNYRVEELFTKATIKQPNEPLDEPLIINDFPSKFAIFGQGYLENPETRTLVLGNPLPRESYAHNLQCIANATGNMMHSSRANNQAMNYIQLTSFDLTAEPVRHLARETCMNYKVELEEFVSTIIVEFTTESGETRSETMATDFYINRYLRTATTKSTIKSISITPNVSYATTVLPHALIVSSNDADPSATITIAAAELVTQSEEFTMVSGEGKKRVTANTLIPKGNVELSAHANRIYSVVKNNVFYIWESRGYPELECGDVVSFEVEDGIFRGLVVENKVNGSRTAARGVTKIRRITD